MYIYSHARLDRVTEGDSEVPRSLLTLCACDVFRALINSLPCLLTELLLDRQGQTRASAAYRVERSEGQSYTTEGKLIVTPSSLCNWTRFVVSFAQYHAWKTSWFRFPVLSCLDFVAFQPRAIFKADLESGIHRQPVKSTVPFVTGQYFVRLRVLRGAVTEW